MRRWTNPTLKWQSLGSKTAVRTFLSFGPIHLSPLNRGFPTRQRLSQRCSGWQQSRSYVEEGLTPCISQRSSESNQRPNLDAVSLSSEHFQDLLDLAARYTIYDVGNLDYESSVNSREGRGTRLVDNPAYQFDYELWELLLRYRMRAYGDEGIKTIWTFLARRDRIGLQPAHWPEQDFCGTSSLLWALET